MRAEGIALDRLSETIQSVEVLPESISQVSSLQSTDPLVHGSPAPGSHVQYSVDLELALRVLTELEQIVGEFRPAPPTPH